MNQALENHPTLQDRPVYIRLNRKTLRGNLTLPKGATGLVVFAHGSGSSRNSPRNLYVSNALNEQGIGTLLIDLLTPREAEIDRESFSLRFDLPLFAERLVRIFDWACFDPYTRHLKLGLFGASTGAGAAVMVAAMRPNRVAAIVSCGGRLDLAEGILCEVQSPCLLIVGEHDNLVQGLNQRALQQLPATAEMKIVPNATHLFEEPGALEQVARLSEQWFHRYLGVTYGFDVQKPSAGRPAPGRYPV